MAARKRPSGNGSNSTRFATVPVNGKEVKIPTTRATAVAWYVANPDGGWPAKQSVMVDTEANWIREGDVVLLQEMRPGHGMGDYTSYRIVEIRNVVRRFEGTYGQILRLVLLAPVASSDSLEDLGAAALEVN